MIYLTDLVGSNTLTLTSLVATITCLYPITVWIYNLYFHPLAKFPGPFLWRASRLPYMRACWGGHFPFVIEKLHQQYGDIIRVAPNELSCRSPQAWDDIYSNRPEAKAFLKSEIWHGNPDGGPASVFVTRDPKEHARIRRFMDPAFSERAVLRQEPIIQQYVDLCIDKLRERASTRNGQVTVNIIDWLNYTLLDTIGDLSFGESFGCLEKCEYEGWMNNMGAAIRVHFLSINLRYYPIAMALLKPLQSWLIPAELIKQTMDYRKRTAAKLDRRLNSDIDRPDIVSQLLRSDDYKEGLSPGEVEQNCKLFINASSETTATTLTGLFNCLLQNPASLSRLEQEIRQFSSDAELTLQALKPLPYLDAALREALRMCGPTPVGNMRITPPEGGMIDGQYVAGNTMVTIPQVALAYCDKYFHKPDEWHPERWLAEAETDATSPFYHDHRKAIRAFGWGTYNCVGEPLAWAEMRLIVAKLLWHFEVKRADTPNAQIAWDKQDVFAIFFKHPLDITLVDRLAGK